MRTRTFLILAAAVVLIMTALAVVYAQDMAPQATQNDREQFERMNTLYNAISENYYKEPEIKNLFSGAVNGMLNLLDPHSSFIDISDYQLFEEQYRGNYEGIGVTFTMLEEKITIMDVVRGGPSDKAGIRTGDRIVEIEGKNAVGFTNDEVQEHLRGPGGTKVAVRLERHNSKELIEATITRGQIPIKSVENAMMLDEDTGYMQIIRFAHMTKYELEGALKSLHRAGMKQLILDLRGNTGGLLPTAIEVTDTFLSGRRLIVYTDGRTEGSLATAHSGHDARDWDIPVVVLVSSGSASASEILAGALQDWDRAVIIGETTFGKGLVQTQFVLSDQSRLALTTQHYYTPTGRLIQRPYKGVDLESYRIQPHFGNGNEVDDLEFKKNRPSYLTPSGRTVYGGGGITPDVEVKEDSPYHRIVYSLNNQLIFFHYANKWINENELDYSFTKFFEDFEITNSMLKDMLELAIERDFVYYPEYGKKLSEKELVSVFFEARDDIKLFLKSVIAEFKYGRMRGFTIRALNRDETLDEARNYFEEAAELAANYSKVDAKHFVAASKGGQQ